MPSYEIIDCYPSKSSPGTVYTVKRRLDTGDLSCDCPGWRFARNGVRYCAHVGVSGKHLGEVQANRVAAIKMKHAIAAKKAHATMAANKRAAQPQPHTIHLPVVPPAMEVPSPFDGVRRRRIILDD